MVQRVIKDSELDARVADYLPRLIETMRSQEAALSDKYTPSTTELIAGWDFRGGAWEVDAVAWSRQLLTDNAQAAIKLPKAVSNRLGDLQRVPHRMSVVTLRRDALKRRPEWAHSYVATLDTICRRCIVYLAHLGDTPSRDWVAAEALRQVQGRGLSPITADLFRQGVQTLAGVKLRELVSHCRTLLLHNDATDVGTTSAELQAWLDDYAAGRPARQARQAELDELVLGEDDLPEPEPANRTQNRCVVPEFVKKPRIDSAKMEFQAIAGKPLPLRRFEGDMAKVSVSLCARWPWAAATVRTLLMDLVGQPWIRFRPTILLGPPGTGKSSLALEIVRAVGLTSTIYSAAGNADGSFGGTSAQWSTARGSVSVQAVLRAMAANPAVIIDEIEKSSLSRRNGNLQDVVLTLVEPVTARCMLDPCLELPVDLSGVSYLATANSLEGISAPLRDRFRILSVPAPGPDHLAVVAGQILHAIRIERGTTDDWLPDLDGDEMSMLFEHWNGGSMRTVRRMIETLLAGREIYAVRH